MDKQEQESRVTNMHQYDTHVTQAHHTTYTDTLTHPHDTHTNTHTQCTVHLCTRALADVTCHTAIHASTNGEGYVALHPDSREAAPIVARPPSGAPAPPARFSQCQPANHPSAKYDKTTVLQVYLMH